MTSIAFIGAGSTVFAKNLMGDILSFPELADSDLRLHDIDEERLETSLVVGEKVSEALGASPTITATTSQDEAIDGADHVITMFQVGGYHPSTVIDFEIPKKYGLRQTIGDTLGIGGIMRALRTIPVLLDLTENMERRCPDATLLQYVNPMAMNCMAIARGSNIETVGLCHSVQHTAEELAGDIGVPADDLEYRCAGINHMAFFLEFGQRTDDGVVDLYPRIRALGRSGDIPERGHPGRSDGGTIGLPDAVRYEMLDRLGYFVTESSEHFSEYVPWFIKSGREDLVTRFGVPIDEYPRRCEYQIDAWEAMRAELTSADTEIDVAPSVEYGAGIIHSIETGTPRVVYGNVANDGLIENLPAGACVEVPCLVDGNGVQPTQVGALPAHLAALMQTNINVQELTVDAALTGDRERVYHAAMLDPHTSSELDLDQIWSMVDELLGAHGEYIPEFEPGRRLGSS